MYYFDYLGYDDQDCEFCSPSFKETAAYAESLGILKIRDTRGGEYFL